MCHPLNIARLLTFPSSVQLSHCPISAKYLPDLLELISLFFHNAGNQYIKRHEKRAHLKRTPSLNGGNSPIKKDRMVETRTFPISFPTSSSHFTAILSLPFGTPKNIRGEWALSSTHNLLIFKMGLAHKNFPNL
jgi:hypothetical protein